MTRKSLLVLIIAILVCSLQISFGQSSYTEYVQNGNGARAAGMGYAFTGLADDATAISWNSAGLTQLYSPEASVIARFGWGSTTPEFSDPSYTVDVTSGSKFQLNFASLAVPFNAGNLNVVGGVAYRRIYDFTMKNTVKIGLPDFNYEGTLETDNSGGVDAISPAVGIQFNEMFSAGVTANILMGSTDYKDSYMENMDLLGSYEDKYSEEYSGVGFDIGILVKASPQFQLGANLNLPASVNITEKYPGYSDYEYKLKVPFFYSIGAAYRASDNVTIAADYHARPWSNAKVESDGEEYDLTGVENANSFHAGIEYLAQAGDNVMPLRIGFYTVPTPGTDDKGDQIILNTVTAGLGLIMGNIILDGAFEYRFGSYSWDQTENIDAKEANFGITVGGTIHFGKD